MRHVYKDPNSGLYYAAGKEHSWGSFPTRSAAEAYDRQVEADDQAYKARLIESRKAIAKEIADEDADRIARVRARAESDRMLYGPATNQPTGDYHDE